MTVEDELYGLKSSRTGEYIHNKTADKMFEELGYVKITTIEDELKIAYKNKRGKTILFSKPLKRIGLIEDYKWFTLEELKAINKKVEELGWLDERKRNNK